MSISCRGPVCVDASTTARGNGSRRARGRARVGSKPCSCNVPGPPFEPKIVICALSFSASGPGVAPKRPLVAASILTAIYYIVRDGVEYRDLGGRYFETLDQAQITKRLVQRLERLGYRVELQ